MSTWSVLFSLAAVFSVVVSDNSVNLKGNSRQRLFFQSNGICSGDQFSCNNNRCIEKDQFCNLHDNCGDNSDESYCLVYECQNKHSHMMCRSRLDYDYQMCIPITWKCDGISDCDDGKDEKECDSLQNVESHMIKARNEAKRWIRNKRKSKNPIQKWGFDVPRTAVALYFSEVGNLTRVKNYTNELTYELTNSFLAKLALRNIGDIRTSELATYVNSFLAFCINPRKLFVVDLVQELRKRTEMQEYPNPFALLVLCNAQELITDSDVEKLLTAFQKANEEYRTDTQAIIIIALACASAQPDAKYKSEDLLDLTMEIKKKQYRNGTVENVKTTALVLQALFAAEAEPDDNNFDEEKAIKQILRSQERDGSFGGLINTYYVLPILSMSSLVNITAARCPKEFTDEYEGLEHLKNQVGEKWNITYSLWIGENKLVQRSLTLSVPANTSFYGIMEYAANLDDKYKFKYNVRSRKPYIFALSGLMDDPEKEMFWYPYYIPKNTTEPVIISKSPGEVIPKNGEHVLFWYTEKKHSL